MTENTQTTTESEDDNKKKFRVSWRTYFSTTVEARSKAEAEDLALLKDFGEAVNYSEAAPEDVAIEDVEISKAREVEK